MATKGDVSITGTPPQHSPSSPPQALLSAPSTPKNVQPSLDRVPVKCGTHTGMLCLNRYSGSGQKGSIKCINSNSVWYSPNEFEQLGGKARSKNWKKSMLHGSTGAQIGTFLASLSLSAANSSIRSSLASSQSPSIQKSNSSCDLATPLVNPLLAFVKAYKLRGDNLGIKQAVLSSFDEVSIASAYRILWDSCKAQLEHLGMQYHQRRTTDKRLASEAIASDIVTACVELDKKQLLPSIYCEAKDLLCIPSLVLDPVSKMLDENSCALTKIDSKLDELSSKVSSACSLPSLDETVSKLQKQLDTLSSSIESFGSKSVPSEMFKPLSHSRTTVKPKPVSQIDRSNNIIIFGLPEMDLNETKSTIDEISVHLIGKPVAIHNAIRVGKRNPDAEFKRPRPIVVKLLNHWDRRLLVSNCRKLKDFSSNYKLFLRADLPPDKRGKRPPKPAIDNGSNENIPDESTSKSVSNTLPTEHAHPVVNSLVAGNSDDTDGVQ